MTSIPNFLSDRFPRFRERIVELANGDVAFQSLVSRYNDVCVELEALQRKRVSGRPEEQELEQRRASLETQLLSVLDADRRV